MEKFYYRQKTRWFCRWIPDVEHVLAWQKELCKRLQLTGKIRIAQEGINATVAGNIQATRSYTTAMLNHPYFEDMTVEDFKVCFTTFANYSAIK